ncbi:HD-GYP domain-containing protein [Thermincola potens]|uniref:Metal dependent phosphohydrolase n=1 Tax=Thermincola potens (strain JR) TaxID=635013 RepID=D5XBB9_THEPJ|nr:HD-GYP domain-containing protein [Thermincola potens]ADG83348.1 metal dependent phosphohydrolase [Thermincola potens JR]
MASGFKKQRLWDISILTALKKNKYSFLIILVFFLIISVFSIIVPTPYKEFMFFFYGIPTIYAGLVYNCSGAFNAAAVSLALHLLASWPGFKTWYKSGQIELLVIEGIFIVVAYLLSCLFITKILINERENQQKLLAMADINAQVAKELAQANRQISQLYTHTIQALAAAIDAKDPYTKGHSERVTNYAVAVARELKLPEKDIRNIFYAAILHDIGKIGISEIILKKPGPLTSAEFKEIKKHPEIGATILSSVPFLEEVIPIVLYHHEYYDGGGYPAGLKGEEIPLGARIISVVDAFDAITTDRPYRKGYSKQSALADIVKGSGIQFDPKIIEVFSKVLEADNIEADLAEVAASVRY